MCGRCDRQPFCAADEKAPLLSQPSALLQGVATGVPVDHRLMQFRFDFTPTMTRATVEKLCIKERSSRALGR
jgi:hypothetical protein